MKHGFYFGLDLLRIERKYSIFNLIFEKGNMDHLDWLSHVELYISFDGKEWKKMKKMELINRIFSSRIQLKINEPFRFVKLEMIGGETKMEIKICEMFMS
jgi:hypothetical protein